MAVLVAVVLVAGLLTAVTREGERTAAGVASPPTTEPQPGERGPGTSVPPSVTTVPREAPRLPNVAPEQRRALEVLMDQVSAVRGLEWKEPLNLRIVGRTEMVRRLRAANARDTNPAQVAAEEAMLKLLDLIPDSLNYAKLRDDLLGGVVLGFYDPETKELYVAVSDVNNLDASEKSTIVHEMVHALTDQHFGYGPKTIELDKADKAEEAMALRALLEGDARLTELRWMERHLTEIEALAVILGVGVEAGDGVDVLSRTPAYIREALYFPYDKGMDFVERLYNSGGFAAVNAAYRRLPASTEQILRPEAYSAGENALPPPLPDVAGASGCRRVRTGSLGEFDTRALLNRHIDVATSERAARGWNGDAYALVRCGSVLGFVNRWEADRSTDAAELAEALGRWAAVWSGGQGTVSGGRFAGPSGAGHINRRGNRVDLVLAQDTATADRLARALGAPVSPAA
ncbi:MAG: hypothetical protein M3203_13295 [Actinomycetota bacterium]|nr:hypothetical protein [Actinomycetota bacterium]